MDYERLTKVVHDLGYTGLRSPQVRPVQTLLQKESLICVLPTGCGKTAVFTIPTLYHNWRTLVISPLLALMENQSKSLNRMGVKAMEISSRTSQTANKLACELWANDTLRMLYVAPERLSTEMFTKLMQDYPPDHVCVDEAHVLSAWGDDFRPDYTHIGDFIDMYKPSVVSAFTATATKHILEDIRRVLRLEKAPFIFNYPRRNNLHYMSITKEIERPVAQCADLIRKYIKDGSAIIYCSTVETVESLSMMLEHELHGDYGVVYYHGQMTSQSLKDLNNRDFMEGAAKVMVATKAFGMGVDKSDVRLVIEFNTSDSLESLAQQQGRAGRDGKEAHCITLWTPQSSSEYYNLFYANSRPSLNQIQRIYKLLVDTAANSPKGAVKLTERQIAGICRINDRIVGSTMGLLDSQGIIRRESNSEDVYSIQFHVDPTEEVYEGSYVRKIYDVINTYGLEREEEKGIYDISMETLHTSLGRSKGTAQSWLRTCVTNQQISYQLPYRGSVTYILRPLDELNFEHIRKKRMLEDRRLQDVMNYCRLPDDEKQDHLIAYFREAVEND